MSTLLIRMSSDLDNDTSEDCELEEENLIEIHVNENASRIFRSNQALDKRIVNIYKLKRFADDYKVNKGKFFQLNSSKEIKELKQ